MQILSWLFSGKIGASRFKRLRSLLVSLGADDLADAYHGIANATCQLGLCVVAIMNPAQQRIEFYISYTHLFGLSAAVVNFNRFPELTTAVARRVGTATTWHFFDDQGVIDFWDEDLDLPSQMAGVGSKSPRKFTSVVKIPEKGAGDTTITADIPEEGLSAQAFIQPLSLGGATFQG